MGITDQIIGVESGGDANAQNPNSTALGPGQFLASTWLDTLAKHRPDISGTPDELLALRTDPQLSQEMTAAYAADNGKTLTSAGYDATPGNAYLAHFAGPQGAVSVLKSDPSTPVAQILGPAVIKANPFLANMTAADLQSWASRKMGGQGQAQNTQSAAAPAGPAPSPAGGQQQAAPSVPMSLLPTGQAAQQAVEPAAQQEPVASPNVAMTPLNNFLAQLSAQQSQPMQQLLPQGRRQTPSVARLQEALKAAGNRGPFFSRG